MKYVALLRGIGPGNPNMQNNKLKAVFEELGFTNVQSVISSGNILFESDSTDVKNLQETIEAAWPQKLGFHSITIIRSQTQLQKLVNLDPFGGLEHGRTSYLLVTFLKKPIKVPFTLPHQPADKPYEIAGATKTELFTVTDTTSIKTPDVMTWLEKQFGKDITSRTWLTVNRILKKMS